MTTPLKYPGTDPRRASALRDALERIAPALAPEWMAVHESGTLGRGIFEIAARLGEQATRRLDQTAQRDASAFFDMLDIPPTAPQAATANLVMRVSDKHETPVFAPPNVQVAAQSDADELIFETINAAWLTPAWLADVVAVDRNNDWIERAPAVITSMEIPETPVPIFIVASFADTGNSTLQLNTSFGLHAGDLLRIGEAAYRIAEVNDNLIDLVDPLEAPAVAGSCVTRIDALEAYRLRDLQTHSFYVGHSDLLNLEQPTRITLRMTPSVVARRLSDLDIRYALWGTRVGDDEPAWHELGQGGSAGADLRLIKSWTGPVEETEIEGRKGRWLRATLAEPIISRPNLGTRVSRLGLLVKSEDGGSNGNAAGSGGSQTVAQAFHNLSPLPLTSRFYPFGSEPLRFDTFALAAPETLSKSGARATVNIQLVDATLLALELAMITIGPPRAYGIGKNGRLQAMVIDANNSFRWQELEHPAELPEAAESGAASLRLNAAELLRAAQLGATQFPLKDLVVAVDADKRLWAGTVKRHNSPSEAFKQPEWTMLPELPAGVAARHLLPMANPGPTAKHTSVLLVAFGNGLVHALRINNDGKATGSWQTVSATSVNAPELIDVGQVVPLQGKQWPQPAPGPDLELVVVDSSGDIWRGTIDPATLKADWQQLNANPGEQAAVDVRPAATLFDTDTAMTGEWVVWAAAADNRLRAWRKTAGPGQVLLAPPDQDSQDEFIAPGGAVLHAIPGLLDFGGNQPIVAAIGKTDGDVVTAMLWTRDDHLAFVALPDADTDLNNPSMVVPGASGGAPSFVIAGKGENLAFGSIDWLREAVDVELNHGIRVGVAVQPEFIELSFAGPGRELVSLTGQERITDINGTVYELPAPLLPHINNGFRFLTLEPGFPDPPVAFDANDPQRLLRGAGDSVTTDGSLLILDGAVYEVTSVDASGATEVLVLDRAVPGGGGATYQLANELSNGTITASNIDTLLHLPNSSSSPRLTALQFDNPTDPGLQPILASDDQVSGVWVLLDHAWISAPPASTVAFLLTELGVQSWSAQNLQRGYNNPELSWEYFDGDGWRRLERNFIDGTDNLATSGKIEFDVPIDLATVDVGGQEDYWIRARLIGGDYGRAQYIVTADNSNAPITTQTIEIDTSQLRPPEIESIEVTFELTTPMAPQQLLVQNNLATLDQTQASAVAQAQFELFEGVGAIHAGGNARAIYLGFSKPIGVNPLVLLADVKDQPGSGRIIAQVLTRQGWSRTTIKDETFGLRRRGLMSIFVNLEPVRTQLFGTEGFWIRLQPEDVGQDDWVPVVYGLYPNAVAVTQARTVQQEILGSGLGEPDAVFTLSETPVLPQSLELRVREAIGEEERSILEEVEFRRRQLLGLAADGPPVVTTYDNIDGEWVLWRRVDSFVDQDGDARVYVLDPKTGAVTFGNDRSGKIPSAGRDTIRAILYQNGGGEQGNIPAYTELKLKSSLEAIDQVVLPVDAGGGIDAPKRAAQVATAPARLRHAGQALTCSDLEALAIASSTEIVQARCFMPVDAKDPVRVAISVRGDGRCPVPPLALRDSVARYLQSFGWGGLGNHAIEVIGPEYMSARVTTLLIAAAERVAAVEDAATRQLLDFLHPSYGGPWSQGWPFGRKIWQSDLLRVLAALDGVEHVETVSFAPVDETVTVDDLSASGLFCIEKPDIDVRVVPGGDA